jgi:hypothetical protein
MTNDWIIDVLVDLKKFSASNNLSVLAEQIDDTIMIASNELALQKPATKLVGCVDETRGRAESSLPRKKRA